MDPIPGVKYHYAVWIFILGLSSASAPPSAYDTTSAANLETALLTSYSTFLRPSSQTDVALGFGISSLNELDIIGQTIYLNGFLLVSWLDSRLAWTPASYGNMDYTMMKMSTIWVPPLVLSNSADGVTVISDDSNIASIPVKVTSGGIIVWILPANFKASCSVDIGYFPFDIQSCSIVVSSWMYETQEVNITADISPEVNTDMYDVNGEWEWVSSSVENSVVSLHGHPHPTVEFTMKLKRKRSYYTMNMLLPVILLTFLGIFVFLLPLDCGEQIGFALTVLLSLSVVMTIVSDKIPTTSTHISVLNVYLLTAFILCSLECAVTVLVTRCYFLDSQGYLLSKKSQPYIGKMTTLFRWQKGHDADEPSSEGKNNANTDTKRTVTVLDIENKVHSAKATNQAGIVCNGRRKNSVAWSKAQTPEREYNYRDVAMILNKVSMVVFTILTVLVTVIYMLILALGDS